MPDAIARMIPLIYKSVQNPRERKLGKPQSLLGKQGAEGHLS